VRRDLRKELEIGLIILESPNVDQGLINFDGVSNKYYLII
jgi:hypothetical protein